LNKIAQDWKLTLKKYKIIIGTLNIRMNVMKKLEVSLKDDLM